MSDPVRPALRLRARQLAMTWTRSIVDYIEEELSKGEAGEIREDVISRAVEERLAINLEAAAQAGEARRSSSQPPTS